jgi:hypothetical protein
MADWVDISIMKLTRQAVTGASSHSPDVPLPGMERASTWRFEMTYLTGKKACKWAARHQGYFSKYD